MRALKIIINGPGGSGKDTFVEYIQSIIRGVESISTIDQVKAIAQTYLDWDGQKDEKGRMLLCDLKKIWINYNDGPFKACVRQIINLENKGKGMIFIHCRESQEIQKLKDRFPGECITLFIFRPGIVVPANVADQNACKFDYDYRISNNGTLNDLFDKAKFFTETLRMKWEKIQPS